MAKTKKEESRQNIKIDNKKYKDENVWLAGCFVLLIIISLVGIIAGVFFLLQKREMKIDKSMPVPKITSIPKFTNKKQIDIKGETDPNMEVIVFVDNKLDKKRTKSESNGKFTINDYEFEKEGTYYFQFATARGWFNKFRSPKSKVFSVVFDTTSPSKDVSLNPLPEKIGVDNIDISGKVSEPSLLVTIVNGDEKFSATSDKNGLFTVKKVALTKGRNRLDVVLTDRAGNKTKVKDVADIVFDPTLAQQQGYINGNNGTISGSNGSSTLPNSAGELEAVINALSNRNTIIVTGIGILVSLLVALANVNIVRRLYK